MPQLTTSNRIILKLLYPYRIKGVGLKNEYQQSSCNENNSMENISSDTHTENRLFEEDKAPKLVNFLTQSSYLFKPNEIIHIIQVTENMEYSKDMYTYRCLDCFYGNFHVER